MATEVEELLGFLSSPSPQVRKAAVDIVQGLTGSEEGLKSLSNHSDTLLASLLNLLGDKKEFVQPVLEALINLSQDTALAGKMVDIGIIERAMEILSKVDTSIVQLLSMLLVNLTQLDSGAERLLQTGNEKLQGLYIAKLVRLFSTSSSENEGVEDPYGHIGSILVNISRMETGRRLLLDPKWSLLKQILRQIDSPSTFRRKGVSGTLRNCCFESETQLGNLLLVSQFLWPALLLPLAGKQEYSKEDTNKMPLELAHPLSHEREPENDPEIRVQAAETLYLIAVHEGGRKALWSVNGPRILEIGYQYEEDPRVMEAYERLGSLVYGIICWGRSELYGVEEQVYVKALHATLHVCITKSSHNIVISYPRKYAMVDAGSREDIPSLLSGGFNEEEAPRNATCRVLPIWKEPLCAENPTLEKHGNK